MSVLLAEQPVTALLNPRREKQAFCVARINRDTPDATMPGAVKLVVWTVSATAPWALLIAAFAGS